MLKVSVGHSEMIDVEDIIDEICEQAESGLEGNEPQVAVAFAAVDLDYQEILSALRCKWPGLKIVGCTTDGESSSQLGFLDDSITIGFFWSDTVDITVGVGRNASQDIHRAAEQAYAQAKSDTEKAPSMCVIMPTSLTASNEQIVNQIRTVVGPDVPMFGASSGDQWRFKKTYQFFNDEVLEDAIPLVLFSGPLHVSSGTQSGWKTIGPVGVVTEVSGNVIQKIDEISALDFYKNLLGPDATPTGDRPLAILDEHDEISRLRASNEMFDPESGAVTFFGEFSVGDKVQITVANRNDILDGTRASIQRAKIGFPDGVSPQAAMFFSCSARKLLLGTRTGEEFEILKEEIGSSIPAFGFYGYGEIGPALTGDKMCEFHNETFVTILLGSSD